MKKVVRILGIWVFVVFVILAGMNIWMGQESKHFLEEKRITLYVDNQRIGVISMIDIEKLARPLKATFQRKVGGPEDHNYRGVPLQSLLAQYDVVVSTDVKVYITAVDGYSVVLTTQEIGQDDNIYLVYEQDGIALDSDFGPYMLVVKEDEISTRWNRNVVSIQIIGDTNGT